MREMREGFKLLQLGEFTFEILKETLHHKAGTAAAVPAQHTCLTNGAQFGNKAWLFLRICCGGQRDSPLPAQGALVCDLSIIHKTLQN